MTKAEQIILIIEKCLFGMPNEEHKGCNCSKKINAILEEVREERDKEILEWIDNNVEYLYNEAGLTDVYINIGTLKQFINKK